MTQTPYTAATNLSGPDLITGANQPDARRYFNNFHSQNFTAGPANDAIVAFFEQQSSNPQAAKNLAAAVLYAAQSQNLDPMMVLTDFQNMPTGQLNSYLAALLNSNRVPTSMLGFRSGAKTNPLVARTIMP
jgi:hypothetical protein